LETPNSEWVDASIDMLVPTPQNQRRSSGSSSRASVSISGSRFGVSP
jgi:hypothetical protein